MVRITVTLPREFLREIDELVGRKHRNEFFIAAVTEKLNRIKAATAQREEVA
jgi:metal-responsive CopG/Arc/MetJ family transcriptional regulator